MLLKQQFEEIWLVDFEFSTPPGETPHVLCMVAQEFISGKTLRYWRDELLLMQHPPFSIGNNALMVCYYAIAEVSCFLSLNWKLPANILDLFVEFRCLTNGLNLACGNNLIGALQYYGLPSIGAEEKQSMQQLAMRGGAYIEEERQALIQYCESDTTALNLLLPKMQEKLDLPRSLIRASYMSTLAIIERNGIPMDYVTLRKLNAHWNDIQNYLIESINPEFGVYENGTFQTERFAEYLHKHDISWPVLSSGRLKLDDGTFQDMVKFYPRLLPLKELRASISCFRLGSLPIGSDGRNRCMLSAFRAKTGRNQPSPAKYIFGPAVWMRGLIKPSEGYGIAYIDWSQQEFGIASALSEDPLMKEAYMSGDPYLEFAKQAGAVPNDATKATHSRERERFKCCVLAVQYGMGADSLAKRAGISPAEARHLLQLHRSTYRKFWDWSDAVLNYTSLNGKIHATYGWTLHKGSDCGERTIRNFPMQGNGSEMLRLACIYGIEAGVKICGPVHDAVLIEAPISILDKHIETMQLAMTRASKDVLNGFELRSGVEKVVYPDRYSDARGFEMWQNVQATLLKITSDVTT